MRRFTRFTSVAAVLVAAALVAAGCSSGQETTADGSGSVEAKDGPITIALLQKQGAQQYFVDEASGAKEKAAALGDVEVDVVDLGTDSNEAISQVDAAIARQVDGLIIVVPDQQIGPQVIHAARNAGIPLLAADDAIEDGEGNPAPFVGFDGYSMGESVGTRAAELYQKAGWSASQTGVMAGWKQDLQTCNDRVAGAADAFEKKAGDLPKVIELGTDNSVTEAQNKAGAALTSNQGVQNWLVWGCNDENVTGIVTALQNGGVDPDNIIGVGLGAYLACKDWKAGEDTGNKAALYLGGPAVGSTAVDTMVEAIRSGTELPENTIVETEMVDAQTWKDSGLVCT